jgi:hypothetical protein
MSTESGKPPPSGGGSPFSPQDALEFMQRMWNPFGIPIPGFGIPGATETHGAVPSGLSSAMPFPNPAAMFAALDPVEIEHKIHELRVIESWLGMSINMMQMSIKTLELQKASLEAMRLAHMPAKPDSGNRKI